MRINRLKVFLSVIVLLSCSLAINAQQPQANELAEYIKANYTKREVMIPVRDGIKLFTAIYEPKDKSQKYPILLNRTPYTVQPYGADKFKTSLGPSALYAKEGYIFVYQDVRGRWMSEGEFEDARPDIENKTPKDIDESTDTYDTIDWLLKNVDNNNGRVGTYGISYPGFYTSAGSIDSHPALKACSPQAPVSDWFHGDDMHHNGALFLAQNYAFFSGFGQPRPVPTSKPDYMTQWKGRNTQDGYDFFLKLGGLKEVADYYQTAVGTRIKFWDDMMAHPNYDSFWEAHNILPKLKNIKCATMTVGGWYDNEDLYGALRTYEHIEAQNPGIYNVLVIGPWDHGGWSRRDGDWLGTGYFTEKTGEYYRAKLELPFFNHFLKDVPGLGDLKEVNVFDTGAHKWISADRENKPAVTDAELELRPGGKLAFVKPKSRPARTYDEYVSDPMKPVPYTQKVTMNYPREFMTEDQRFVAGRPDVLVYQTEPLEKDVTAIGDIMPSLTVSTSGTDSDFIVKIIDVFPDDYKYPDGMKPDFYGAGVFQPGGYQMLLRGEPMPARFRKGFEKPVPMRPNVPENVTFTMPGIAHTFKKGHRIMVQIQSTWFPLVARNPQKFMPNYKMGTQADFQKATERVYHGSKIIFRVLNK